MSTLPGFLPFGEDRGQGEAYRAVCFDWVKAQPVAWSWFATLTCARAPTTEEALDLAFIKSKLERLWRLGNALVTPIAGLDSALGYTLKALPRGANINFSRSVFPLKG